MNDEGYVREKSLQPIEFFDEDDPFFKQEPQILN